jgi:hypothetical protein
MDNEVVVTNAYIAEMDRRPEFAALFKSKITDPQLRYWMGRFEEKLSQRGRNYERTRTQIMFDFSEKDEKGSVVYDVSLSSEKKEIRTPIIADPLTYRVELNKLLDMEIPLEMPRFKIKVADLPGEWLPNDLYILGPFLDVQGVS